MTELYIDGDNRQHVESLELLEQMYRNKETMVKELRVGHVKMIVYYSKGTEIDDEFMFHL